MACIQHGLRAGVLMAPPRLLCEGQMTTVKLRKPLHDGPVVITSITLCVPSSREVVSWPKSMPGDEFDRALTGIGLLSGVHPKVLEQLSARDFTALANAAAAIYEGI